MTPIGGIPLYGDALRKAIVYYSQKYGVDPNIPLSVAPHEGGYGGSIGDEGTSFGPFQLHIGGALPPGKDQRWAQSAEGVDYAIRQVASTVKGLQGEAAVRAMVSNFERPAASYLPGEITNSIATYRQLLGQALPQAQQPMTTGGQQAPTPTVAQQAQTPQLPTPIQRINQLYQQSALSPGLRQNLTQGGGTLAKIVGMISQTSPFAGLTQLPPSFTGHKEVKFVADTPHVPAAAAPVVNAARQYLGTPYHYGGANPRTGFDCSGFVQFVYAKQGINLPRTTYGQLKSGTKVGLQELQPGDILFFDKGGHEGMYIGGGHFIHAPHTGDVVKISSLSSPWYRQHFYTARRVANASAANAA